MITIIYYSIGFLVYLSYSIFTFIVYSKKTGMTKSLALISIYLFYTTLAGYIINLVDRGASFFEKFIQIGIYALVAGLVLNYYYNDIILKKEKKDKYLTTRTDEDDEDEKNPYGF